MYSSSFLARLVPLAATLFLAELLHNNPVSAAPGIPLVQKRYAAGWCGVHVTQHQKNEPDNPSGNYKLDISIKDASGAGIGGVGGADAPAGQGVGVTSQLPAVLIVTTGNVDDDAVLFDYNGAHWGSNDQQHSCNFGAYDTGKREGDCGFTC